MPPPIIWNNIILIIFGLRPTLEEALLYEKLLKEEYNYLSSRMLFTSSIEQQEQLQLIKEALKKIVRYIFKLQYPKQEYIDYLEE